MMLKCCMRPARQPNNPVSFGWLGNAPTREQVVHCFILTGEREPHGRHGEIQSAVTRLVRFVAANKHSDAFERSAVNTSWQLSYAPTCFGATHREMVRLIRKG